MVELTSTLPDPESMAQFCVAVLAIIVAWDAWWLARQRVDIPILESCQMAVMFGNLINLRGITTMGQPDDCWCDDGLTLMLAELSNTPMIWVWIWDTLLAIHLIFCYCLRGMQ